jgi:diguanylate cyclase (GGDEF)-like protein
LGPIVGILSNYLSGAYEGPIVCAVHRLTAQAGGRVVAVQTSCTGRDYHRQVTLPDFAHVGWRRIDGFVTVANPVPMDYLEALREAGKPVVAIGHEEPGFSCPTVLADNDGGVRLAIEHLLGHGHRRIAFVGYMGEFDIRQRYDAYRATLLDQGVQPDPALVFEADNDFEHGGVPAARALLAAGLPSTAVFAATDLNAVAVMKVLKEAGLSLPRDQAVVAFDDDPDAALVSPSLSTVVQDVSHLGSLAAELLMRQLSGEAVIPGRYTVPTSFRVRRSCGCTGTMAGPRSAAVRRGPRGEPRPRAEEPVVAFLEAMGHAGARESDVDQAAVAELAQGVSRIYREAAARALPQALLSELDGLCRHLYAIRPSSTTRNAVLSLAAGLAEDLSQSRPRRPGRVERLGQCTYQVRLSLTEALLEERSDSYFELRKLVRDDYQITLELLDNREQDPRLLGWLANTEAGAGVLGLWTDPSAGVAPGKGALDIVGTFDGLAGSSGAKAAASLGPRTIEVENFPPEEFFGVGGDVPLVCVFPLRGAEGDWGFLAVAQPPVSRLGQETYFTWSALFALEERLRQQALYDSLTGLPNRALFLDRLSTAMTVTRRPPGNSYAVLWLDVDDFKSVNDTLGHLYGDELLVQVAARIRASVRNTDTPARFGGDEFVVLLQGDDDLVAVERVLRRLSARLNEPYYLGSQVVPATVSIGVAIGNPAYERPDDVLRDADTAMYSAKSARPGSCVTVEVPTPLQ